MANFYILKNTVGLKKILTAGLLFTSVIYQTNASELTIPHTFQPKTPAKAAEVNANFSATASAVNDNNSRINLLETSLSTLSSRLDALESQQQNVTISYETFYATDLFFVLNDSDGNLLFPVVAGNQTPSQYVVTNYLYHPIPGLNNVTFNVANNGTTAIIRTTGETYLTDFSAWAQLEIAISVDGITPAQSAYGKIHIVSDNNISSGGATWDITLPVQLDAGSHQFSVLIRGSNQNQGNITIDGRSGGDYPGKVKASVMQIYDGH